MVFSLTKTYDFITTKYVFKIFLGKLWNLNIENNLLEYTKIYLNIIIFIQNILKEIKNEKI